MEQEQVRTRVAIAVGLKLGVDNAKARIVGDAVLRVIQECGLLTVVASDLAKVNDLVATGFLQNAKLREALVEIEKVAGDDQTVKAICEAALADPGDIVIEGETAPTTNLNS